MRILRIRPVVVCALTHIERRRMKPRCGQRQRVKDDPTYVAAARELRDRWLEQVNPNRYLPATAAKYDVRRTSTRAIPSLNEYTSIRAADDMQPARLLVA